MSLRSSAMTQTGSSTTALQVCAFVYTFTGKERDIESGNDYFGARYYGSSMGRFISPDYSDDDDGPVSIPYYDPSNPQSLNLYSYVHNNPLSSTDPDGHDCINTSNLQQDGTVTVTTGTSCASDPGKYGTYVDGTVDTKSLTTDGHGSLGYSYSNYADGSGSAGGSVISPSVPYDPLESPADRATAGMIGNGGMSAIKDFAIGSVVGGAVGGAVLASGAGAAALTTLGDLGSGVTEHAEEAKLLARHGITPEQARAAIEAAKRSGDVVEAMGRYGPQLRYTANGIRVVVATTGRNAGKIITAFFK